MIRFFKDSKAVALLEFALALPILILLLLGGIEMSSYANAHLKVDKTAHTLGDVIGRSPFICGDKIDNLIQSSAPQLMRPFRINNGLRVVVNFVEVLPAPGPTANSGKAYSRITTNVRSGLAQNSRLVNPANDMATLPAAFNYTRAGSHFITVEIFYNYIGYLNLNTLGFDFGNRLIYKYVVIPTRFVAPPALLSPADAACACNINLDSLDSISGGAANDNLSNPALSAKVFSNPELLTSSSLSSSAVAAVVPALPRANGMIMPSVNAPIPAVPACDWCGTYRNDSFNSKAPCYPGNTPDRGFSACVENCSCLPPYVPPPPPVYTDSDDDNHDDNGDSDGDNGGNGGGGGGGGGDAGGDAGGGDNGDDGGDNGGGGGDGSGGGGQGGGNSQ